MRKRKTLREQCEESIRKLLGEHYDEKSMVWEYERKLWLKGYRAAKRAKRSSP